MQVRWKTFVLLCGKYIQDNVYKILSESAGFCKRRDKIFSFVFFGSQFQLPLFKKRER